MVFCTGWAGCGCVELGRELCALCETYCLTTVQNSNFHTVNTARNPAPHNHSQHNQCRTPYAVERRLVLLKTGIMMPETCWDRSLITNIRLVASCWFLSLHPILCTWFWLSYQLIESHFIAMVMTGLDFLLCEWLSQALFQVLPGLHCYDTAWVVTDSQTQVSIESHQGRFVCVCEYHVTPPQHGHI